MEVIQTINPSLQDEHVIAIDPPMKPDQPGVWRRRINAFAGRAVSEKALTAEQDMRAGLQRLHGLSMTAGVVDGMTVMPEIDAIGAAPGKARLQLFAGIGIARSGEDVSIGTTRQFAIGDIPVVLPVDLANTLAAAPQSGAATPDAALRVAVPPAPMAAPSALRLVRPMLSSGNSRLTVLPQMRPISLPTARDGLPMADRLLPDPPRNIAGKLSKLLESKQAGLMPRAAVLVAQPIDATILGRKTADCPPDPRDDPYSDLQRIDGTRLLLVMWPQEMTARGSGPDYLLPPITPLRRNQLAYRVFDMERTFQQSEMHPWEAWGVPLALIGFRDDWSLDFVDRASVVRPGGQPKKRTTMVPLSGEAGLWQARINQMIEHLGGLPDLGAETLRATFQRVPPACVLPADVFDSISGRQGFFPSGFGTNAIPVPKSSLEIAIKEASGLIPFNLSVADRVEMLVPVPDELYDPGLLTEEKIDSSFETKIDQFRKDRDRWLVNREIIRRRYDRLRESVSGIAMSWPQIGMADAEFCPPASMSAPLSVTRTRGYNAIGSSKVHAVETKATLPVTAGDTLWFWVRVRTAPDGLSLRFAGPPNNLGITTYGHGVYWGNADGMDITAITTTGLAARKVGELPIAAGWMKLEVPADRPWTVPGTALSGFQIAAVEFAQKGGDIEYGPMGKTDANGQTTVWIGDTARAAATYRHGTTSGNMVAGDWSWAPVADRVPDVMPEFGTQVIANAMSVAAVEAFRAQWSKESFLVADINRLDEFGVNSYIDDLQARLKATNDAIDVGFVRARSDIYRVRQFMLGADSASRLVTSPALADLARRDEGARVTSVGISDFIKKSKLETTGEYTFTTTATAIKQTAPTTNRDNFNAVKAEINVMPAPVMATFVPMPQMFMMAKPAASPRLFDVSAVAAASAAKGITAVNAPAPSITRSFDKQPVAASVSTELVATGLRTIQPEAPVASLSMLRGATLPRTLGVAQITPLLFDYATKDIRAQRPAPGLVERTLSVAERLTPPPSVQALEYAVASKAAVIQTLQGLRQLNNGRPNGVALDGIFVPGYAFKKGTTNDADLDKPPPTIDQLIDDLTKKTGLFIDVDDVREKLKSQTAKHESDYFTAAVQAIDNAIALMRLVEDRVTLFERLLEEARELQSTTLSNMAQAAAQLRLIDTEVEESRHDLSTAQSLFEEEETRISELNTRRKAILANNVTMIAYRRVRETDHRRFAPTLKLGSGLEETAMAACRREHPDTPSEVSDYVALFRDAPVKYFPRIAAEVKRIDKAEAAAKALERARQQAMLEQARQAAEMQFQVQQMQMISAMPLFLQSAHKMQITQRQALVARRIRMTNLDGAAIPRLSLAQVHQEFGEHATLSDAADGTHNAPQLVQMATALLADFTGVAACLHAEFAETPAAIRLEWAETLSQFDGEVDLQSLASLPRWGQVDRDQRRRLQSLASWFYTRIDRDNPKAMALISNLVRITLLLAAHAPVRRLIPARLIGENPARIGTRLMLDVDIRNIRKGMSTIIRDRHNKIISRAVIEDMIDGRASARIIHVAPQITTIFPDMRVELSSQIIRMAKIG
jgi:hypothetical protein